VENDKKVKYFRTQQVQINVGNSYSVFMSQMKRILEVFQCEITKVVSQIPAVLMWIPAV